MVGGGGGGEGGGASRVLRGRPRPLGSCGRDERAQTLVTPPFRCQLASPRWVILPEAHGAKAEDYLRGLRLVGMTVALRLPGFPFLLFHPGE